MPKIEQHTAPGYTRLLIVRHGESEANRRNIMTGSLDPALTDTGVEQAQRLGEYLSHEDIDLIISSDLQRAQQTTAEIKKFVQAPIVYDSRLRERCVGEFEGLPRPLFYDTLANCGQPIQEYRPPQGESLLDLQQRVEEFLSSLNTSQTPQTILLSAHHQVNKMILMCSGYLDWQDWLNVILRNCSLSIVELDGACQSWPVAVNITKHLDS